MRTPLVVYDAREHLATDLLLTFGIIGSGVYVTTRAQGATSLSFVSGFAAASMLLGAGTLAHSVPSFVPPDRPPTVAVVEPDIAQGTVTSNSEN